MLCHTHRAVNRDVTTDPTYPSISTLGPLPQNTAAAQAGHYRVRGNIPRAPEAWPRGRAHTLPGMLQPG